MNALKNHHKQIIQTISLLVICLILFSGCALNKINKQKKVIENQGTLTGTIVKPKGYTGNIIVQLYKLEEGILHLRLNRTVAHNGHFCITTLPDSYLLFAFADSNEDSKYQHDELAELYGSPTEVTVLENEETNIGALQVNRILQVENPRKISIENNLPIWENIGEIVQLTDPRFLSDHYKVGMWRPLDFFQTAEGGLFLLEEFDKTKMPVFLVHGSTGGPLHWETVINGLDKDLFQPVLLYYPSGVRLELICDFMLEAINRFKIQNDISEFAIFAHSMGGLITRSFAQKYIDFKPENINDIKIVATICSPFNGSNSVASGVKNSPIVVPAWRDLTPESEFVKKIQKWDWPKEIPFHLIVSFEKSKSNDGVVDLSSQAPQKQQAESTRMYLFNNNHAEILTNPDLVKLINNLLKSSIK